jgi:hypothetical protein
MTKLQLLNELKDLRRKLLQVPNDMTVLVDMQQKLFELQERLVLEGIKEEQQLYRVVCSNSLLN